MQLAITSSDQLATATASSWPTPKASKMAPRSSGDAAFWASKKASPSPGVCQILAKSCHS
jgi:hypothetical protein